MVQLKLLLLILWIGSVQSMASPPPPPSDYLDLMNVENLTFYRYEWTTGGRKRLQFNCVKPCPEELTAVLCTNNDYRKFDKVNATRLNWSCNSDELSDSLYYIGENDSEVQCEEVNRTTTERNVIRGSCSVTLTLSYKWFKIYLLWMGVGMAIYLGYKGTRFLISFIRDRIQARSRNDYNQV